MNRRMNAWRTAVGAIGLGTLVVGAMAQPSERQRGRDRSQVKPEEKAALTQPEFDMQASMAEWLKYAEPGEHHRLLEPMVGTFIANVKTWMDRASSEPVSSVGEMTTRWVLGGRYLQYHFTTDEFMDMPFEGMGMMGYDNFGKVYQNVWWDTLGTATYLTTGTVDSTGKIFTFEGVMNDPSQGGAEVKSREVTRLIDANSYVTEMFHTMPDGSRMKIMEIMYTRKKSS